MVTNPTIHAQQNRYPNPAKNRHTKNRYPKTTRKAPMISKDLLRTSILQDSFFDFIQYYWNRIIPEEPVWNWHIEYLCEELQKMAIRVFNNEPKLYDLVINVPPGSTKSTICSIMLPPWLWINMPSARSICGSYSYPLALELSRKSRDIVLDESYYRMFGIELRYDQHGKGYFVNENGGYRYSTSTGGSVTGFHGHLLIVDDPLNPQEAASETELKSANTWLRETLSTRKVDKKITPTILIMQRLHELDPSAMMLEKKEGVKVKHINLPAEIDKKNYKTVRPRSLKRRYVKDPDQEGSRLLDPKRMDRAVLQESLSKLLEYGYAGQFLQTPVPPEGGLFKVERFHIENLPPVSVDLIQKVRFWDKAGTEGGGAFTVGVLMAEDKEGRFWVMDVIRKQLDSGEREKLIKMTAQMDGVDTIIGVEQEPGSGGKESAENTVRNLKGYITEVVRPTGSKETRALPFSSQVNVGNVYMVKAEWNQIYLNELILFPKSKFKDQVDASSGAFTALAFSGGRIGVW